jgi:hypothetical protein
MNVVLCYLAGGGDIDMFILPEDVYDWMRTVKPGEYQLPENVITALIPFRGEDFNEDAWNEVREEHHASFGSCENDVAMTLACLVHSYPTIREAFATIDTNQWLLVDEYHGCIY